MTRAMIMARQCPTANLHHHPSWLKNLAKHTDGSFQIYKEQIPPNAARCPYAQSYESRFDEDEDSRWNYSSTLLLASGLEKKFINTKLKRSFRRIHAPIGYHNSQGSQVPTRASPDGSGPLPGLFSLSGAYIRSRHRRIFRKSATKHIKPGELA
ncbi:hypothetical protein CPC08DRAFT_144790 [Agrocybe pediades]|nr:hypothetical protein CPC08DRAFT_144790 [Agrocybe pediades]